MDLCVRSSARASGGLDCTPFCAADVNSDFQFSSPSSSVPTIMPGSAVTVKKKRKSAESLVSSETGQHARRHTSDPCNNSEKSKQLPQNAGRATTLLLLVGSFAGRATTLLPLVGNTHTHTHTPSIIHTHAHAPENDVRAPLCVGIECPDKKRCLHGSKHLNERQRHNEKQRKSHIQRVREV